MGNWLLLSLNLLHFWYCTAYAETIGVSLLGPNPFSPMPLGPLALGPLPLGHCPTSSYFVQSHSFILHLVPLLFSPSDRRSRGQKDRSSLVQLSLGSIILYLSFGPTIFWSNYHLVQSSFSPISITSNQFFVIIWSNHLLVQLSFGPIIS